MFGHLASLVDLIDPTPDILSRNIYYKDPALFRSQNVVDRYIDIVAYTLGVQRADLNVVSSRTISGFCKHPINWFLPPKTAAAKGLVAGSFTVTRRDRTVGSEKSHSAVNVSA